MEAKKCLSNNSNQTCEGETKMTNNKNEEILLIQVGSKSLTRANNSIEITNKLLNTDLDKGIDKTLEQTKDEDIDSKKNIAKGLEKQEISNETKAKIVLAVRAAHAKKIANVAEEANLATMEQKKELLELKIKQILSKRK
jgi:superfamily I DNA and/or RNA helicase